MLKKTNPPSSSDNDIIVRAAHDYETLRDYAVNREGYDGVESELAIFISHGAAAWIRSSGDKRQQRPVERRQGTREMNEGMLAILLANIMEESECSEL